MVSIDGVDTSTLTDKYLAGLRARRIGFVFQQFFLLPGQTALENVANGLLYQGVEPRQRLLRAELALNRVGLAHRLHHKPNELSGGEQQRVAVARALAHEPAFVLADEPTAALDSERAGIVMDLLRKVAVDQQAAIAVVTHDEKIYGRLDHIFQLRDGVLDKEQAITSVL
jgi:putative ABC transport system ATP-binding protein